MSDSHQTQVVPEGSGDVARAIVGEQQFGRLTRALVRSSRETSVMPVRSTASWTTSMNESEVLIQQGQLLASRGLEQHAGGNTLISHVDYV